MSVRLTIIGGTWSRLIVVRPTEYNNTARVTVKYSRIADH